MKRLTKHFTLLVAVAALSLTALVSCSKDDDAQPQTPYSCATCVDTPEALAANDNSAKGIYKGVFIGSTGTLHINIQNGSSTITAVMVIDGQTINLTSSVQVVDGEPYIAPFTGMMGQTPVSITFSVGLSGANPTVVTSSIPGHPNAVFNVYKETSASLIEAFEGTYSVSSGETGTFNLLMTRATNVWGAIAKENGENDTDYVNGTINSNNQLIEAEEGTMIGTVNGDVITGSFQDSSNSTVTIQGNRTL